MPHSQAVIASGEEDGIGRVRRGGQQVPHRDVAPGQTLDQGPAKERLEAEAEV
jgi:hypothetical protein